MGLLSWSTYSATLPYPSPQPEKKVVVGCCSAPRCAPDRSKTSGLFVSSPDLNEQNWFCSIVAISSEEEKQELKVGRSFQLDSNRLCEKKMINFVAEKFFNFWSFWKEWAREKKITGCCRCRRSRSFEVLHHSPGLVATMSQRPERGKKMKRVELRRASLIRASW